MRVTSDCPLLDPQVSAAVLAGLSGSAAVAVSATRELRPSRGYPLGFDTEVFDVQALCMRRRRKRRIRYDREHVTPYIWKRPKEYPGRHRSIRRQIAGIGD